MILCGCQMNKTINGLSEEPTIFDTEQNISEQTSNTIEQMDIDLINKNAQYLSNALNMQMNAALSLAKVMYSVGIDEIDTITEVKRDEKVWKIEIVDIQQAKYCINLSSEGYLGLIYKDKFGGQPIYYKLDD